jgi:uncharacterized repeat protein (TIGR03803 family)
MTRTFFQVTVVTLVGLALTLVFTGAAQAATEKVLYSFSGGPDGNGPAAPLVFDAAGNLYGTTQQGGSAGFGTVFELSPGSDGTWSERILYSFLGGADGSTPGAAALTFDGAGNLYGTTFAGGTANMGTVFKLTPGNGGNWSETVIHTFSGPDGSTPTANVIFDKAGNLYSITDSGGTTGQGNVFELTPEGNGTWSEKVLFNFPQNFPYGTQPYAGLTFDSSGNLYGTTQYAGSKGSGNVFELSPSGDTWTIKNLHTFAGSPDGQYPEGNVIFDNAGNLYSTTAYGGASSCSCGTVFRLTPSGGGNWTEKVIHSFADTPGKGPYVGLVLNPSSNSLYGTTDYDENQFNGTVFQLSLDTGTLTTLHVFTGPDGSAPNGLVLDSAGNLYGTTTLGGSLGYGTVFEVTP